MKRGEQIWRADVQPKLAVPALESQNDRARRHDDSSTEMLRRIQRQKLKLNVWVHSDEDDKLEDRKKWDGKAKEDS